MASEIAKQDRVGARVPHDVYETLCRAAELSGARGLVRLSGMMIFRVLIVVPTRSFSRP